MAPFSDESAHRRIDFTITALAHRHHSWHHLGVPTFVLIEELQRMVKQAAAARPGEELDPIDRLEDKIKRLVELIAQLRADQERASAENRRLAQELDAVRTQLTEAERANAELTTLRDERDMIRTRVAEMLEQLEGI